jgi:hypothetical protein
LLLAFAEHGIPEERLIGLLELLDTFRWMIDQLHLALAEKVTHKENLTE